MVRRVFPVWGREKKRKGEAEGRVVPDGGSVWVDRQSRCWQKKRRGGEGKNKENGREWGRKIGERKERARPTRKEKRTTFWDRREEGETKRAN